ncbi:MAG: hypothetical protein K2I90_01405 [Odoribacter sp.]|nr:hypothetical protein [Odoribacter sp.]
MGYLKERIKHVFRFRHKRGYGVHSPFMFHLILNVIRDREKQFAYPEAWEKSKVLRAREKKVFRLLSRLIRHLQVRQVVCLGDGAGLLKEYLAQVCGETVILGNVPGGLEQADFVYVGDGAEEFLPEGFSWVPSSAGKSGCLVVADIYRNPFNARIWRLYRERATVSVDMLWYGVLIFDDKIQKGKYSLKI